MAKILVSLDEVVAYFDELEDPRSEVNLKHPLVSVVVIAMLAVLSNGDRKVGGPQRGLPLEGIEVAQRHSP